jgi:hypothetical protein
MGTAQASGAYSELKPVERIWVFMPYMHSEDLGDQQARLPQHNAKAAHHMACPNELVCMPPQAGPCWASWRDRQGSVLYRSRWRSCKM